MCDVIENSPPQAVNHHQIFGKAFWKLAINFLLDNWFSNFGNLSFWQIIEVMGSDVAPVMTNRSMYYYENKWLLDT